MSNLSSNKMWWRQAAGTPFAASLLALQGTKTALLPHQFCCTVCRYSPNLSKRTTHLVAPAFVTNVSQKLLAATEDSRYPGLHVVSSDWLQTSIKLQSKANEASYRPNIPQASKAGGPYVTPAPSSTSSRQPSSVSATPAAAAAPQTPWVVHFSQMGDSIYGVPEANSPNSHEQFVQQLQPIAELPSPPSGAPGKVSPEVAAVLAASKTGSRSQHAAVTDRQAGLTQHFVRPSSEAVVAAAPASLGNAHRPAPLQVAIDRSSPKAASAARHIAAGVQLPDILQELLAAPSTAGIRERRELKGSPSSLHRPPPLQLGSNSSSCPGAAQLNATGVGLYASIAADSHVHVGPVGSVLGQQQQQQHEAPYPAAVKQPEGSASSTGSVEQLLQALRQPSRHTPGTAATPDIQIAAPPAAAAPALRNISTVDELTGAVYGAVGGADSRRATAQAPMAEIGPRQTAHPLVAGQRQWQRQQQPQLEHSPKAQDSKNVSSVDELIGALRRVTGDVPGTAAAAGYSSDVDDSAVSAGDSSALQQRAQHGSLDDSSTKISSLLYAWHQVKEHAQQIREAPHALSPAGGDVERRLDVHLQQLQAADGSALATVSSVPELVAALRQANRDSRRATAEAAVAEAAALPLSQSEQQGAPSPAATSLLATLPDSVGKPEPGVQPGTGLGSFKSVDELIGALRRATGSSVRTTRESATADDPAAEHQAAAAAPTEEGIAAGSTGSQNGQGLFGSIANVDELILALRRATGSRRSTAESAAQPLSLLQQEQEGGDTGFESLETMDDLLKAISRATSDSSRRGTNDLVAGDQQHGLQPEQQQLVRDQIRSGEVGNDHNTRSILGSFSDVDALQALRRATGSRRGTGEVAADVTGHQEQQEQGTATGSSLEELLSALRRPTPDSRRGTADTVAAAVLPAGVAPAAVEAIGLGLSPPPQQQQQGQQQSSNTDSILNLARALQTGGAVHPAEVPALAGSAAEEAGAISRPNLVALQDQHQWQDVEASSSDGVHQLMQALRQRSGKERPTGEPAIRSPPAATNSSLTPALDAAAKRQQRYPNGLGDSRRGEVEAATTAAAGAASTPAARDAVGRHEQLILSSPRNIHELVGALRNVTDDRRTGTAAAGSAAADDVIQPLQTTPSSPRNIHELVGALRKVTGGSRRGTVEAAAAARDASSTTAADAAILQQQQQHTPSSPRNVQELVGALRRVTGSSRRGLAKTATPGISSKADAAFQQQQQASTSPRNLRDIVGALRVVTGNLEDRPAAPVLSGESSTTAANAGLLLQQQQPLGSPGTADEPVGTLHNATGASSRGSTLAASGSPISAVDVALQQQQQQQHAPNSPRSVHELVGALRCVTGDHSKLSFDAVTGPLAADHQQQQQRLPTSPNAVDGLLVDLGKAMGLGSAHNTCRTKTAAAAARQVSATPPTVGVTTAAETHKLVGPAGGTGLNQLVEALRGRPSDGRRATADQLTSSTAAADLAAASPGPGSDVAGPGQQRGADSPGDIGQLLSTLRRVTGDKGPSDSVLPTAEETAATAAGGGHVHGDSSSSSSHDTGTPYKFPTSTQEGTAAAAAAGYDGAQQQGSNQQSFWASIIAVIDPAISPHVQQQLQQILAAAGATVVPGQPHLGCGANTVITEPDRAALWLPLLMDLVSPAWVLKACQQQQQQQQNVPQLLRLSPDLARAVGQQLVGTGTDSSLTARHHTNSHMSSTRDAAFVASDSRGELVVLPAVGGGPAAERLLMPRQLLTDIIWSIDQDPRSIEDGEAAAVLFQSGPSSISLLLPQDSGGLLSYAITKCTASEGAQGISCGDVLSAIHSFYQQEVLLQEDRLAGDRSSINGQDSTQQQQQQGRVVRRVVLMGSRLMFEGLVRATQDPHSTLYEVCVA